MTQVLRTGVLSNWAISLAPPFPVLIYWGCGVSCTLSKLSSTELYSKAHWYFETGSHLTKLPSLVLNSFINSARPRTWGPAAASASHVARVTGHTTRCQIWYLFVLVFFFWLVAVYLFVLCFEMSFEVTMKIFFASISQVLGKNHRSFSQTQFILCWELNLGHHARKVFYQLSCIPNSLDEPQDLNEWHQCWVALTDMCYGASKASLQPTISGAWP